MNYCDYLLYVTCIINNNLYSLHKKTYIYKTHKYIKSKHVIIQNRYNDYSVYKNKIYRKLNKTYMWL